MRLSEANKLRILYFLVFCCTAAWLPIFADYCRDQGLDGIESGIILSVPPFMMFLVQPFYGMMADRYGYKKNLLLSSLLAAACFSLYLVQGGFAYLFLVTVFMALFYNALQPVLDSLSLKLVQASPSFSYGTLRIAGAAGWAFTGIINGYLIDAIDTGVIFTVAAISMLLTFIFAFSLHNDNSKHVSGQTPGFSNIRKMFACKTLLFVLVCVFLVSAGATTIWNYYSLYMKENGASASLVGYGLSFQGLCELPFFYFSARIIGRLGLRTTLIVTITATAVRLLLYSLIKNPLAAIPVELLHGISWSLFWVACVEYVNRLVREEWRVTGQSLLYAAYFGAGAIAGNFWTGYLSDSGISLSRIFLLNAGIVLLVAIAIAAFIYKKPASSHAMIQGTANAPEK